MTDISDLATDHEMLRRDLAIQAQQRRADLNGKTVSDSATECKECDEAIPEERRAAVPGCSFCVSCQAQRERTFYER